MAVPRKTVTKDDQAEGYQISDGGVQDPFEQRKKDEAARKSYLRGSYKGGESTRFDPRRPPGQAMHDVPVYTAEQRFSGGVGEEGLIGRGADVLKRREEALKGYESGELRALRGQLAGESKAMTAQNIRQATAGQGRYGVSGATAARQVGDIRMAGQAEERKAGEKALLMQKEAKGEALDAYETDVLGRQLAIQSEEVGKEQTSLAREGIMQGIAMSRPHYPGGGLTMLCAAVIGQGLLPNDLMASEVIEADKLTGLMTSPAVMCGYIFLCGWMARLAVKSKWFAKLISPLVTAWMRDMAFRFGLRKKKSYLGNFTNIIGQKICGLIGRVKHA